MRTDIESAEREYPPFGNWRLIAWAEKYAPSLLADVRELAAENEELTERIKNFESQPTITRPTFEAEED